MEAKIELKFILTTVNDMLKFAEAKNGALLVFNSGLVFAILSNYHNIHHCVYKWIILFGIICFGISVCLCLLSQFPVTENIFYSRADIQEPNLYFYNHLSNLDKGSFISEYKTAHEDFVPTKLDEYVINQILKNARIAQAKFTIFKFAISVTSIGAGVIALTTIVKVIWRF
jgi:hypothetical protein